MTTDACSSPHLTCLGFCGIVAWKLNGALCPMMEECIKQHYMVVYDFSPHILCVKKCKFSPCIQTWKLSGPATASLFQSAFKVKKTWLLQLQLPPLLAQMMRWVSLVKEGPLAGCFHQRFWSLIEPPLETRNLLVEWRGGQSYTREACTVQGLQCPEERRHDGGGQ